MEVFRFFFFSSCAAALHVDKLIVCRNAAHDRQALPFREQEVISDEGGGLLQVIAFVDQVKDMAGCRPQLMDRFR